MAKQEEEEIEKRRLTEQNKRKQKELQEKKEACERENKRLKDLQEKEEQKVKLLYDHEKVNKITPITVIILHFNYFQKLKLLNNQADVIF